MEPIVPLTDVDNFAEGLDHAEGICAAPDGTIYCGGEAGQLYVINADDTPREIANTGGFMLGLAADGDGNIYAIDLVNSTVWRFSPDGSERSAFCTGNDEQSLAVPNWGAFDADGNYYLTDSGGWGEQNGHVWVQRPGAQAEVWSTESVNFPNGCAVSADGSRLWIVESYPSAIVEIPIESDGSAGARRELCDLGLAVPDGIVETTDGSLVVSCYRPDTIFVWHAETGLQVLTTDPRGAIIAAPTNCVFTGDDRDVLVFPNLGRWHLSRFRTPYRGVGCFYPSAARIDGDE